ncbi:uncharacterized protein F5891DRAFT_1181900 [Suillus fuscotomentosus]|uniref:Uncharacterized protein n=1 Tax=Suillus fuscotomentosus TaxID=1912939 RepID=A0AAD4EHU6_9AGAM|nr:uncharacterized protein F5891DRAFT_1181900 [Suillus fuscotomentosus]KAG1906489.1 hypothetical protein F5891DRAFT_1181900 [Suillus fuscotomentosus]
MAFNLADGCSLIFQWVFIPWLQRELDGYKDHVNNSAKRHDCNKVLPHGVPNLIYESPEDFWALDFKIILEPSTIDHVRSTYIDPDHALFDLVPQEFGHFIQDYYHELGRPSVNRQSAWTVYLHLHHTISRLYEQLPPVVLTDNEDDPLPLLENHQDLPFHKNDDRDYYMGGDDEPDVGDNYLEGLDHAGLVVWEFSEDEDEAVVDEW